MKFTYGHKLEMARQVRATNVVQTIMSLEYEKNLELVNCNERIITTSEGESHVYLITPKKSKDIYPLYINIHGGGFVRPYAKRDTVFCSKIAAEVGCKVIDIDYKLAPEHPFPEGLNECYAIVKWAFDNAKELNIDIEDVILGGHSSGGNFTAAIAVMANKSKDFKLKYQIMDYPFLDAVTDPGDKALEGDILPADRARKFNALYVDNEDDKHNPLVSLVLATKEMLIGLPPALVITAAYDSLRTEAEKYVMIMVEAGVEVKIKRFLNSKHGFIVNCQQEFEEAQRLIIKTLKQGFYNF
ncbi:alpha/beta hydrolase [Clostridium estertheticum]|uniref:alpha/beta hydrolase n=1 Tax=Clostridium estertheticum TaxID=238834 RepID=UPI001C6E5E53|nr:alpha/beta hydrolase [Clostridium estertheticum]MBW9171562.1 alpha/beta hydrolase [Clostridium estertheticum]WLC77059.1 alpha/beta hydrolase [Clostridium estertheticum]